MPFDRILKLRLSIAFIVAVGLAITVVVQAPRFLNSPKENSNFYPNVATIEYLEGDVQISRKSETATAQQPFRSLLIEDRLQHLDRLVLKDGSKIAFAVSESSPELQETYKFEFTGPADLVFEKWNWQVKKTPLLVFIDAGMDLEFNIINRGLRGDVYFVNQNIMYAPESKKKKPSLEMVVRIDGTSVATSNVDVVESDEVIKSLPEKTHPEDAAQDKKSGFIAQKLSEQRDEFIKCQSNAIRENQGSKGELLIGFLIQKNGRPEDIKVLKSTVENPSLEACVISVIQRMTFLTVDSPSQELDRMRTSFPILFQ